MLSWERQVKEFCSIRRQIAEKNSLGLRFNRILIGASDVADQFFCEKKVEMRYTYGKIETLEKIRGAQAHEKLLEGMAKIDLADLWKKIYAAKPLYVSEMFLLARYKEIILAGVPDAIVFNSGVPIVLFEYKFTRATQPSNSHRIQVRTYGLLLQSMGFDTKKLFHGIVLVDPKLRNDPRLRQNVVDAVSENGPKEAVLKTEKAAIHIEKFSQDQAQRDLDWAIEYWKRQREAVPTDNQSKCERCEYRRKCKGENIQLDDLNALPLVGSSRAEAFAKIGIENIEHVSKIDPFDARFRDYSCFSPGVLSLIKNYATAVVQNKILVKRKADLLKNEKICFLDLEYDPSGTRTGPYGVFLIGILDEDGKVTQHFLDNPEDEDKMLSQFTSWYEKEKPVFVSYSSTSADRPQLLNSLARLKIPTLGIERAFFDLYFGCINTQRIDVQNVFLPMRGSMGLKDVSKSLGYREPSDLRISDGLQALFMYAEYLKTKNETVKTDLLQYNLVDLERTKFVFDKIRASLEQADDSLILETKLPPNAHEFTIASTNVADFTCPKCRHFHSSTYIKRKLPRRCYRCGYIFSQK